MITSMLELESNRGNHLTMDLLEARYPALCTNQTRSSLSQPLRTIAIDLELQQMLYHSYLDHHDVTEFPVNLGEEMTNDERTLMLLFLVIISNCYYWFNQRLSNL